MTMRLTRNQLWLVQLAADGKVYQGADRNSFAADMWSNAGKGDLIVTDRVSLLRDRGVLELDNAISGDRRWWRPTAAGRELLARDDRRIERNRRKVLGEHG